jgi:hypothetical protein
MKRRTLVLRVTVALPTVQAAAASAPSFVWSDAAIGGGASAGVRLVGRGFASGGAPSSTPVRGMIRLTPAHVRGGGSYSGDAEIGCRHAAQSKGEHHA